MYLGERVVYVEDERGWDWSAGMSYVVDLRVCRGKVTAFTNTQVTIERPTWWGWGHDHIVVDRNRVFGSRQELLDHIENRNEKTAGPVAGT